MPYGYSRRFAVPAQVVELRLKHTMNNGVLVVEVELGGVKGPVYADRLVIEEDMLRPDGAAPRPATTNTEGDHERTDR